MEVATLNKWMFRPNSIMEGVLVQTGEKAYSDREIVSPSEKTSQFRR